MGVRSVPMKVELKRCELHTPLFLGGKNLQTKLDPSKTHGLELMWDTDEKVLYVTWQGEVGEIPEANIAVRVRGKPRIVQAVTPAQRVPVDAQVSTPQSHVHAGPGHGKSK